MTDPRVTALAAAVIKASDDGKWSVYHTEGGVSWMDRREAAAAILAALPPDWCGHRPPEGTRLVLVNIDALSMFGTRTYDGRALTAEWGEPDEHGWYNPTFTATGPAEIARLRKIEEAARAHALDEPHLTNSGGMWESLDALRAALGDEP